MYMGHYLKTREVEIFDCASASLNTPKTTTTTPMATTTICNVNAVSTELMAQWIIGNRYDVRY